MKKVIRILLISAILCVSGCDFLRKVAGRPTAAELESKAARIEAIEAQTAEAAAKTDTTALTDALKELAEMGVNTSSVFRFGTPQRELQKKYNIIAGVFRKAGSAAAIVAKARESGYDAFLIAFPNGIDAVCLTADDSPKELPRLINKARKDGLCPADAWIYIKND